MSEVLTAVGTIAVAILGVWAGHWKAKRDAEVQSKSSEHQMIDQLQEEVKEYRDQLRRYQDRTDSRLEYLERTNQAYRAFIGVQRDHMAAHGTPLPPWPDDLPR